MKEPDIDKTWQYIFLYSFLHSHKYIGYVEVLKWLLRKCTFWSFLISSRGQWDAKIYRQFSFAGKHLWFLGFHMKVKLDSICVDTISFCLFVCQWIVYHKFNFNEAIFKFTSWMYLFKMIYKFSTSREIYRTEKIIFKI